MAALLMGCLAVGASALSVKDILGKKETRSFSPEEYASMTVIDTIYGSIQGDIHAGVRQFRSIPYAQPPVGELRWAPPEPPISWTDVKMTNTDPVGCPQSCGLPPHGCPLSTEEDCLFLNVFTPIPQNTANPKYIKDDGELLPVLFWIHGGTYLAGYGGGPLYNGSYYSLNEDIIIVSINYRLGALGYLWSLVGPSGNYGMMDQRLALQWTRDNIAFFGGDPNQITIAGESAGAMSVGLHMMNSVDQEPLFRGAIMESNPFGIPFRDPQTWGDLPHAFYKEIGCDSERFEHDNGGFWECIRAVSSDDIITAQNKVQNDIALELPDHFWDLFVPWTPTVGTDMFPEQPFWKFQKGDVYDVPFIIGTNRDEGLLFVMGAIGAPMNKIETDALIEVLVGPELAPMIKKQYPYPDNTTDYRYWASQVVGDGLFRCTSYNSTEARMVERQKGSKKTPSWLYQFNHVSSFAPAFWGNHDSYCIPAVCHSAELVYVWHPNAEVDDTTYTDDELWLILHFGAYWSTFTSTLEPGSGYPNAPASNAGVEWTEFSQNKSTLFLDVGPLQMMGDWDAQFCDFWDTTGYTWIK